MKVYTPNLVLVEYNGKLPRKLWESKTVDMPTMKEGDRVLLPKITAVLMDRKRDFTIVDNKDIFANETSKKTHHTIESPNMTKEQLKEFAEEYNARDLTVSELYQPPTLEEIDTLNEESIFRACEYFGIKAGKRKADTVKPILMPYLKKSKVEE